MTNVLTIESALSDDLIVTEDDVPYAIALRAGTYVIADPELVLQNHNWHEFAKIAEMESPPAVGPGGIVYAARINGHAVSGMTTYISAGDFDTGNENLITSRSGVISAIPVALLDELGIDYSREMLTEIVSDDVINYSDSIQTIFFGEDAAIYTGYPDDGE